VATSAVWYGLQAIAEGLITSAFNFLFYTRQGWDESCFHVVLLSRALLKARTGLQRSDSVVNYLIRRVIQTGFVAALWVVAESVTWFLLPKTAAYRIFDMTVGAMYTHVSGLYRNHHVYLEWRIGNIWHTSIPYPTSQTHGRIYSCWDCVFRVPRGAGLVSFRSYSHW
jgi:hypothetical protein